MFKRSIFFSLLFLLLVSSTCLAAEDSRYLFIGESPSFSLYIDTRTIIQTQNKDIFEVWEKIVYTEKGKEEYIKGRQKRNLDTSNYSNLAFTLNKYRYKISTYCGNCIAVCDYSDDNTLLDSSSRDIYPSIPIVPNTIGEAIYEATINYLKENKRL